MESIVKLGKVEPGDRLGNDFHNAAKFGNKRRLKKILDKGIQVDYPNNMGQSPLFCACCNNEEAVVKELLKYGANPNERSNNGMTPVHMVAYNCNVQLMAELLAAGGDLRLHDTIGRTSKEFTMFQPDLKKRMKMLEFIEKTRLFALTKSGRDLRASLKSPQGSNKRQLVTPRTNSFIKLIRDKIRGESSVNLDHQMRSCHSLGFGKVYQDGDSFSGIICTLPLVSDLLLKHDTDGFTFNNGAFMVMESMLWNNTKVTVKRLHRDAAPGGEVDLLISEAEYIGKIRHPSILTLMGVCQTNNLESMVLLFERIDVGSLYEVLHQKLERLSRSHIKDITYQISDALVFLHGQNIYHCFVTSHAVMLVNTHCAKLANFEYVVDCEKVDAGRKSFVNQNMYQNVAYNWMAPEIMRDSPPSAASDVYSLSVIVWEMFHGEVPWGKYDTETVRYKLLKNNEQLAIESDRIPEVFMLILQHGLQLDPLHRKLHMHNVRNILTIPKENVQQYMEKLLREEEEKRPAKPARPKSWKRGETLDNRTTTTSVRPSNQDPSVSGHHGTAGEGLDRSPIKSPRSEHSTPRRSPPDANIDKRYNHNQSSKDPSYPDYLRNDKYRFVDQMCFSHKDLDWQLKEEQQGTDFYYTVSVNKDKEVKSEQSESEVGSTVSERGNRSLFNKFSYLELQQQCKSPPGNCVKPASHCTDAHVECPPEKRLTTAGSVFALYNMDYQTPQRVTTDARSQLYNTMPRKRKRMAGETPQTTELGPSIKDWYGGAGSVKNLVEMYQKQQEEHNFQQDLLKGRLSSADISRHQKNSLYPDIKNLSPSRSPRDSNNQNQKTLTSAKRQSSDCDVTNSSSLTTVSPEDCKGKSSSPDSDMVDDWVDTELYRIQSTLSQEIFEAIDEKKKANVSPLLFEENCSTPYDSKKKPPVKKQIQNKTKQQYEVEEIYIDDDINHETHKLTPRKTNVTSKDRNVDYIIPQREVFHHNESNNKQQTDKHKVRNRSPQKRQRQYSNDMDHSKSKVTYKTPEYNHRKYYNNDREFCEEYNSYVNNRKSHKQKQYQDDSEVSSDSFVISRAEKNKELKRLQTSFHSIPQHYDETVACRTSQIVDEDTYPRIVEALSETDQQKLKKKVEERAAFASTVVVETSTLHPDQHRVTHTLTDLSDGTTSTLYGKNVKATRLMSALIAQ